MDKEAEIVAKKIESGEYFAEGVSWFHSKFTGPRTEFAYVSIICLIALAALFTGFLSFGEIFPLSPGQNFVISRPLKAGEHIKIEALRDGSETTDEAVIRYILSQYVIAREEYKPDITESFDRNFKFITAVSESNVLKDYLDMISVNNPQNPLSVYGAQASKDIKIIKVEIQKSGKGETKNYNRAIVTYSTRLIYTSDTTQEVSNYEADISFQYKQIIVDQKTGKISTPPELEITDYKTRAL